MYRCAYICDFSRSVASLEHDADLQPLELHPLLQIDQLLVQLVEVLLVLLPLELLLRLTLGHELAPSSPAGVETSRARKRRCAASIRMTRCASCVVNRQGSSHHGLRFLHDGLEVSLALEALRVELVDVLRAGRSGGEPARVGDDLQS